jgi:flagellar protein FliO/FliZ
MQWLNELPFADNRVLQIGFLAACGIAALIVLAILYRLTFAHRLRVPGGRTRQPRLGLVDAFSLDGQRQLVLIRRDNIEHLVMIGGPNDVLVESQINRAVVPARESNQTAPLLVPSTPVRRAEVATLPASPAVAEPAPKVAAKVPASPAAPAAVPAATPPALAPATIVAPPVPKAPAPAQPTASVSDQPAVPAQTSVPAQAPAPELTRSASAPQAAEPARPAAANSPPPRQADSRSAQPRATMPSPIIPTNASPNRGASARSTETVPPRGPGNPPGQSPAAPAPPRRPEKAEPAVAGSKAESIAPMAKTEASATPVTAVPPARSGLAPAPAPKTVASAPASDWARKAADARLPVDKTNGAPNVKPSPKVDDPFADLDSLEAEMARLLGREKSD